MRVFRGGGAVLIYPEEQMWFNYRRPRPGRHGVYDYAAQLNIPIVSLFTEIIDTGKPEPSDPEFNKNRYVVHVLDTLYPDPSLPADERSKALRRADDAQRKAAYERIYGKPHDALGIAAAAAAVPAGWMHPPSAGHSQGASRHETANQQYKIKDSHVWHREGGKFRFMYQCAYSIFFAVSW